MSTQSRRHEGITIRHSRACPAFEQRASRCRCKPTFMAKVHVPGDKPRYKTFPTLAAAKSWRADARVAIDNGKLAPNTKVTIREAAEAWLAGAKAGTILGKGGKPFSPTTLRGYEASIRNRLIPDLGGIKLTDLTHKAVQLYAEKLLRGGSDPSTVRNHLAPLRVIYRRHHKLGDVSHNPTSGVELPRSRGQRDRVASPAEAEALIRALPEHDRALWATAFYAGLRRGELMALDWSNVNLGTGRIRVERSVSERGEWGPPKSASGIRTVPIIPALRDYLTEHAAVTGHREGLLFGSTPDRPFTPSAVRRRAATAWKNTNKLLADDATKLAPIGLHECRHTCASMLIAAGINIKAVSVIMGHSSVSFTLDRYGHLMSDSLDDAAAQLESYVRRQVAAAELEAVHDRASAVAS